MNSDELSGKSGKVKVMYVRRDEDSEPDTGRNKKSGGRGARGGDRFSDRDDRPQRRDRNPAGKRGAGRERGRYEESDRRQPRTERGRWRGADQERDERDANFSPWSTSSRLAQLKSEPAGADDLPADEIIDHGGISGKSDIDPEILRRQRAEETRIYGENACQALFAHRPESIVRGWFSEEITPRFRDALRWLAANRKAYHVVDADELLKVSGTEHHGGVCFLIKKRAGVTVADWLADPQNSGQQCVLALDNVANPHNIGAIMRSCAHFGVRGLLVENAALLESGAAVRTAEGGAEHVQAIASDDLISALKQFRKAGYQIVATSSHKGTSLFSATLPEKMVLLLGQEHGGISAAALAMADTRIAISGTGQVESLNVSVATGVLLAEWWRQRGK